MLRQRNFFFALLIAVLSISGTAFSQRNSAEVTVTKCWQFPADDIADLRTNGSDIFVADGGRVVALSSSGQKLWQTDLGGEVLPGIKIDKGAVAVTTRSSSGAVAVNRLSLTTGVPAPAAKDPDPPPNGEVSNGTAASASASDAVILGDSAGVVTSLSGGGPVWKFKTGGAISAVVPVGDRFIVISRDNFVYALRARNGGLDWKRRMQGRIGHYALGKEFLLVTSLEQHGATFIDLDSGRVAGQILLNGDEQVLADPLIVNGDFVVPTDAGLTDYSLSGCAAK